MQLFALGYKHKKTSYFFTATEKNNLLITYPKNALMLLLNGNAQFIGQEIDIKSTGVYFNHYREYAFGLSKKINSQLRVGTKAKILFGKFNVSTKSLNLNINSDPTTFNLDFADDINLRTSLPILIDASNLQFNSISYNENVSIKQLFLNRKNPGIAFDAGFIYNLDKNTELAASIIDFGFIRWGINLNQFIADGQFQFQGIYGLNNNSFFQDLGNTLIDSLNLTVNSNAYFMWLPLKTMAGMQHNFTDKISAGIVNNTVLYRMKINTSLTFTSTYKPFGWLGLTGSYSIQNYSLNNLGFGFFVGNRGVQFYAVSDNLLFIPKPLDTRNVNFRFGLNVLFGCEQKHKQAKKRKATEFTCFGVANPDRKKYREELVPWQKQMKKRKRQQKLKKLF